MFKLARFLKPYWWQVIILLLAVALQTWFTLQLPAMMADIVNNGISKSDYTYIWQTGAKMLLYSVFIVIGAISSSFFSAKVGAGFSKDLRTAIFSKVLTFSTSDLEKFSTASLITRTTNDINQVQQAFIMIFSMLLRAPMMCIVAIVQAFATAPTMTWIIALGVVLFIFFAIIILSAAMPKFKLFQKLLDKITLLTRENLTGLKVIRAFNNEELDKKKFTEVNNELTRTIISVTKLLGLASPLTTLILNEICLLCIWVGISYLSANIAYLGNMMAFMQYATHVVFSFLVLTIVLFSIPRANISANRINEVFRTKPKIHWPKVTKGKPSKIPSVVFKNVKFSYSSSAEENVLENISFEAKVGETTAIVGSTGSGKSTIINLLMRFYDTTEGEIFVDGINIKDYAKKDLFSKIGYVPQQGFLFSGTIDSNINFGNAKSSPENTKSAAKISQSEEFINKMSDKYKSRIARGGSNVSGGQKQRLSIARAIAKNPEIYAFDDSFSALDMKTDAKLRQELAKNSKNAVTVIVAQRISTIKNAENIIVLNQGKIVGKGTHYQLLKNCKVYREIVKSQLQDTEYEKELAHARS